MYISVKQAAEKWGVSDRKVRTLCEKGKIAGAKREGRFWKIPSEAKKPVESLLENIDRKKKELDSRRL